MKKPGIISGGIAAGLLSLPLFAVLFIGSQLAGFPFVPFSVFDNVRDVTPGGIIAFTINAMVTVIDGLKLGRTDTSAKIAEESMAILFTLVILIIAGAVFYWAMRRVEKAQEWIPGAAFGLIVGIPMTILCLVGNQVYSADHVTSAVWVLGLFLLWGYFNNSIYNRLAYETRVVMPAEPSGKATVEPIDRRRFLIQLGGTTAAITVVGALVGSFLDEGGTQTVSSGVTGANATQAVQANLPNSSASVAPAPGTRPELTDVADFYRIDISLEPPSIDLNSWTLPWYDATAGDGSKTKIMDMSMSDIRKFTPVKKYITQGCISNPVGGSLISTVEWTGAKMQDVVASVKLPANATHLLITGADGFYETVALDLIKSEPRVILGYDWAGQPLPVPHGFPLRIHVPNLYGMKQPKWITEIDVLSHDEDGYWVDRGWDKTASVQATSVIDTVATANVTTTNGQKIVPVGGIAWAGDRGISKVEVSVDGGTWAEAELRDPLSEETWVIWRYDWPYASGDHTFAVRCYDKSGTIQISDVASEAPSGATGIDQVTATI